MTQDQFRTRFMWDADPIKGCWTNVLGERLRNTDPKYLPLASLRRDEGAHRVKGESGISQRIHRLSYETFIGPCEKTPRQACGNPLCFNPDHLKPEGRNGWKRTALSKCQKCGEMKPRQEMREIGKRHYRCKTHDRQVMPTRENDLFMKALRQLRTEKRCEFSRKQREHRRAEYNHQQVCKWMMNYKSDPVAYVKACLRRRISNMIRTKGLNCGLRTQELIGCTYEQFKEHIEKQFRPGMTWDNKGKWHIDHIRPLSSFDLLNPQEQKRAFHYTNCQPLWARQNLRKHDRWDGQLDLIDNAV